MAAGAAALTGCTGKAPDTAPIVAMIRADTTAWVNAYNSGDADKIVGFYADDAVMMPPDAPAVVGRDAMKQFLVGDMETAKTAGATFVLDTDTAAVSGNLAWHSGTFHVNGPGGTSVGSGKYLEVWQQQKGNNWLMIRDIWNMDAAAAPPPPPPEAAKAPAKPAKKKHKK